MNIRVFLKNNIFNFYLAIEAVLANKVRSLLTALGIIFGVAAVIAMLAIGNGAQEEILKQIKLVGVNNIVIQPVQKDKNEDTKDNKTKEKEKFSPGLTLEDAEAIKSIVPHIERISPEIILDKMAVREGLSASIKLIGVTEDYFHLYSFDVKEGKLFDKHQLRTGEPVCIIGKTIQSKFFSKENPIGKQIKCGNNWLTVVGVLEDRSVSETAKSNLGIRNFNMDIYTPIKTVLLRYENRALVTASSLNKGMGNDDDDEGGNKKEIKNLNQLDKLVIQVKETEMLKPVSEVIGRMLQRRHNQLPDYEISIPEMLLKQQQRTKDIFNMVLAAIAGISLVVGGIGIMNIMLASVLERIKEIGLRLSIGAKKQDIIFQFLCEAVFISVSGGIVGIILGVTLSLLISKITGIITIISFSSILISFGVSATVGLIFGISPARKAAMQDPIQSLRYE